MSEFLQFLGLPVDADEETATLSLTALLTSAVRDASPAATLPDIYHKVSTLNGSQYLDPLNALPLLVESPDPKAQDLIGIIGECCSAKETLIASQECLERLVRDLRQPHDQEDDEEKRTPVDALIIIVGLYGAIIPKVKLRNKSAFETVRPHLEEIQEAVGAAEYRLKGDDVQNLLASVATLVKNVNEWFKNDPKDVESNSTQKQALLLDLLSHTLSSSSHALRTSIAQRTFEDIYPRFKLRQSTEEPWKEAEDALKQLFGVFEDLGKPPQDLIRTPSLTSLVALAHFSLNDITKTATLSSFLPYIIASIQTNSLLDESLAILLKYLCQEPRPSITADQAGPLLSVLPELASGHSDPQIRHLTFRILSRLLSLSPPALRIQTLADLASHSEFPQMRTAAVGLVKEALLEAFSLPKESPFASPLFLRVFGPILFRSDPAELLTSASTSLADFEESQEPRRLVECLSLYYVLLERDAHNLTGVRDADVVRNVENTLLAPLRSKLIEWEAESEETDGHEHDHQMTPLMPLQIALERVDSAKVSLKL